MLEAYCANASREGRKCDSTIKATKSVIRRFLFALEDNEVSLFGGGTLKQISDTITKLALNYSIKKGHGLK